MGGMGGSGGNGAGRFAEDLLSSGDGSDGSDDDGGGAAAAVEGCMVCDSHEYDDVLLLCDGRREGGEQCPNGAHTFCVGLASVPAGDWLCTECIEAQANGGSGVAAGFRFEV